MEDMFCDLDRYDRCKRCKRHAHLEVRRAYEGDVPCGVKLEKLFEDLKRSLTKLGNSIDGSNKAGFPWETEMIVKKLRELAERT